MIILSVFITFIIFFSLKHLEKHQQLQHGIDNSPSGISQLLPPTNFGIRHASVTESKFLPRNSRRDNFERVYSDSLNATSSISKSVHLKYNSRSNRNKIFWNIWIVSRGTSNLEGLDSGFIRVRQNSSLSSRVVGTLTSGTVFIGRRIRLIKIKDSGFDNSVIVTRIETLFPVMGWVTAHVSSSGAPYILALDISFSALKTVTNTTYSSFSSATNKEDPCLDRSHNGTSSFLHNTDLLGGDLAADGNANADSPVTCCKLCQANPNCKAWTWTSDIGSEFDGQCWLKGGPYRLVHEGPLSAPRLGQPQPQHQPQHQPQPHNKKNRNCISGILNPNSQPHNQQLLKPFDNPIISKRSQNPRSLVSGNIFVDTLCCNVSLTSESESMDKSIFNTENENSSNISLQFLSDFRSEATIHLKDRRNAIQPSPYLLNIQRTSNDWTEKWPIGNGRFGALIGGTIKLDQVPLSIAGFFVKPKQPPENAIHTDGNIFHEARELFKTGHIKLATSKLNELAKSGLGMFQYLFDLRISYHSESPSAGKNEGGSIHSTGEGEDFGPLLLSDGALDIRQGVASSSYLEQHLPAARHAARKLTATKGGKKSLFKRKKRRKLTKKTRFSSSLRYHFREWFASEVDQVMVGRMACRTLETTSFETPHINSNESASARHAETTQRKNRKLSDRFTTNFEQENDSCLHLAVQLLREVPPELIENAPQYTVSIRPTELSEKVKDRWTIESPEQGKGIKELYFHNFIIIIIIITILLLFFLLLYVYSFFFSKYNLFLHVERTLEAVTFEAVLKSTVTQTAPLTIASGVLLCVSSDHNNYDGNSNVRERNLKMDEQNTIHCSNADNLYIILSIESEYKYGYRDGSLPNPTLQGLRRKTEENIKNALNLGFQDLKIRHTSQFAERMERVDIHFGSFNETQTCANSLEEGRLDSFYSGCIVSNAGQTEDLFQSNNSMVKQFISYFQLLSYHHLKMVIYHLLCLLFRILRILLFFFTICRKLIIAIFENCLLFFRRILKATV